MFVYPIVCSFKQSNSSTRTRSENWLTTQNKVIFSKITIKLVEMILSKPWATTGTMEMGRELFEYKRTPSLNKGMTLDSFLAREQALHFGDSREFTRETRERRCECEGRWRVLSRLTSLAVRELKHQTFLIHERHGWPRRTGSRTRFACQMQLIKQNNVKPSRTPTE